MHRAAHRVLNSDPVMAALIAAAGPCRLRARELQPPFEALSRAIAHQQLHGAAAQRILARFIALFGSATFPSPQQVLDAPEGQLRGVGFSYAKIAALKDLARLTLDGTVPPSAQLALLGDDEIVERLCRVRGIGRWTVEMMLMFQLSRRDVLPVDDFGVRNGFRLAYGLRGMPTPRALSQFGERWKPWRSVAAWYLWRAVELARDGRLAPCALSPRIALVKPRKGEPRKAKHRKTKRRGRQRAVSAVARPVPRARR